jgi:hypothetical protein
MISSCYKGLTYPKILANRIVWWFWKKYMCPKGKHLLDECWSPPNWYLSCDACNLEVHINKVSEVNCK